MWKVIAQDNAEIMDLGDFDDLQEAIRTEYEVKLHTTIPDSALITTVTTDQYKHLTSFSPIEDVPFVPYDDGEPL